LFIVSRHCRCGNKSLLSTYVKYFNRIDLIFSAAPVPPPRRGQPAAGKDQCLPILLKNSS
jgi:hypothetical protein